MHSVFLIKIAWKICRIVSHHYIERILWIWFFIINQTGCTMYLNNRFVRERGMASNPKMEYQVFLCIFQKKSAMATLGLKKMGKFLMEGRKKGLPCWLSQFSKTKLRQPTGQTFFPTFPKEFSSFLQTPKPQMRKITWSILDS